MTIENDLNNFETFVSNEFGNRQILLTGEGPPSLTSGASSTVGIGAFYIDNVTRKRYERKETDWELFYDESGAGLYGQWNQITAADSNPEYDIITGGENILADTELGEITLRLPPNPNELDLIIIVPLKPTYEFNNLKINANGSNINGDSSGDLIVLSEPNLSVQLIYVGGDAGWAFFRLGDSVIINRESNSGTFLQKVFTDEQLDPGNGTGLLGEGTASDPLSIETGKFIEEIESTTDFTGTGKSGSPLTLNTNFIESVVSDSDFTGDGINGDPLKLTNTYLQTVQTTNDLTGTGSSANKLALSTSIKNDISTAISTANTAISDANTAISDANTAISAVNSINDNPYTWTQTQTFSQPILNSDSKIKHNIASFFAGNILGGASAQVGIPNGWTCVRTGVGQWTVTHNLGYIVYPQVTPFDFPDIQFQIQTHLYVGFIGSNSFSIFALSDAQNTTGDKGPLIEAEFVVMVPF